MFKLFRSNSLGLNEEVSKELAYSGSKFQGIFEKHQILLNGKDNIQIGWWLSLFPGLAILVTVLSYNLLGEGLRDALDPRLRGMSG